MNPLKNLAVSITVLLLATCVIGAYLTRDAGSGRSAKKPAPSAQAAPVDERLLQTARQMNSIADTGDEQNFAGQAMQLADHEVDQAFSAALREAEAAVPPASGPLRELADRISQLKASVAADQARIAKLTKQAETKPAASDQLELAQAQLSLDQDELNDAQQDLVRQGGDQHAKIQQALQQHEAAEQQAEKMPKAAAPGRTVTLIDQAQLWFSLWNRSRQLETARLQAANTAASLTREHDTLERLIKKQPIPDISAAPPEPTSDENSSDDETAPQEDTATMVARLRHLSDQQKSLATLDQRIQDTQHLSDVYKNWEDYVGETRMGGVQHLVYQSLSVVFGILLAVLLIVNAIHHAFGQQTDRRQRHQLQTIASIGVQVMGGLFILFVIVGPPTQMSTIIGLTTAGLTVVMKDFIVAFFGWFNLMGKNGVRVGDWVEINGVSGEVIEIRVLKTVLLEMGNWASTGHPTGRRVSVMNSYAIEGHYFNFSTAGQWLWDELQVTLGSNEDPYVKSQEIRQTVERETAKDAAEAEQEWERVTRQYGTRTFSAKPAVDLRPSPNGLTVIVRYITRAPQRYEVRSRLFTAIVELLHKPAGSVNPA
jgi:small-conductance mechanosensitive channel